MKQFAAAALVAASVLAMPAYADVEETIEYRQSVYRVVKWNFGPLRAMATGKQDYDAATAARNAARIAQMAMMLEDAYPPGSTAEGSDARPKIWDQWADFETKLGDFQRASAALAETTAEGGEDAFKAAFVEMAATCKACHDEYKD